MARSALAPTLPGPARDQAPIPPLWKESLWPFDWLTLHMSPVYYGCAVPPGDGSAVVLVPGFMGSDAYLFELYLWLARIGYRPYMSGIGVNAECPAKLATRLTATLRRANKETGRPARMIGHSLGGLLARRACLRSPDLVSQLIYLGSPLKGIRAHPAVLATAALLRFARALVTSTEPDCLTERCGCGFAEDLLSPLPADLHHAAVFSRGDGVVDWRDTQERDPRLNHEVGGTHIGLVYNPRAYEVLAELLAEG